MTRVMVCIKIDNGEPGPFDSAALEAALRLDDREVIMLCMGPESAARPLEALLRLGVNRAILLCDPVFAGADTLATSYALSVAAKKLRPDLILCGRQSVSGDTAQVGPSLAGVLGIPFVSRALSLKLCDNEIRCLTRECETTSPLPALVTVERIHTLRLPRAFGKKGGELEIWTSANLLIDPVRCGLSGSPTRVVQTFENKRGKRRCVFVNPADVPGLIREHQQLKLFVPTLSESKEKLDTVWAIGDEVYDIALTVGKKVEVLPREDPLVIAALATQKCPDAILWPSNSWGRQAAPQAAVALQTGLCADCTSLEVSGGELLMIRPTHGGSLMGKIRCLTRPAMATVRVESQSTGDVLLSIGRGAKGQEEKAFAASRMLDSELGASRAAVDAGMAPYPIQVGLTGRVVSPDVYLALGISGAIAHTCAIEGSGCVIAVNVDKRARIFEYADYGVVGDVKETLEIILNKWGDVNA